MTRLKARALELGFDDCRITTPDAIPQAAAGLRAFLDEGAHGDMDWLADTAARRADPRALWPDMKSLVMVAMNYGPDRDPRAGLAQRQTGTISVYAQHRDYHEVMKGKLKMLLQWFQSRSGAKAKVFVDTAPLMEKPLAAAAGLGWQGKHTNLVSRRFGSWLFLGAMATDLAMPADQPEADACGSCQACLDICPTRAFPAPYRLDARRCISYLTIEHKGHIAREFRRAIGNRIYGCDDCLAVCPWNKFASVAREAKLRARDGATAPPLAELLGLDEPQFRSRFAGSPVKRAGHTRFLRNVLIAAGNSGEARLIPAVAAHLTAAEPVIRAMAVWALAELETPDAFRRRAAMVHEADPDVVAEWCNEVRLEGRPPLQPDMSHLLCFGFGFSARALATRLRAEGWQISATSRSAEGLAAIAAAGANPLNFEAAPDFTTVSHVLISAPPGPDGDPVLAQHGKTLAAHACNIAWCGYLSTTGVYGDRDGGWVSEDSPLAPSTERGLLRLQAETQWLELWRSTGLPVHLFRLAGIYGPGRNQLQALRLGTARRVVKPGQVFSRIHVDDIAGVLAASLAQPQAGRAYNVCDDEPCPPQDVVAFGAALLGLPAPPEVSFAQAELSAMGRSFYAESKRVSNQRIKSELGYRLIYPTYREGLTALAGLVPTPSAATAPDALAPTAGDRRP